MFLSDAMQEHNLGLFPFGVENGALDFNVIANVQGTIQAVTVLHNRKLLHIRCLVKMFNIKRLNLFNVTSELKKIFL